MSPTNRRGAPVQGYEKKTHKIYARVEPYEYQEFMQAIRITGDTAADALRQGMHMYVQTVKARLTGHEYERNG